MITIEFKGIYKLCIVYKPMLTVSFVSVILWMFKLSEIFRDMPQGICFLPCYLAIVIHLLFCPLTNFSCWLTLMPVSVAKLVNIGFLCHYLLDKLAKFLYAVTFEIFVFMFEITQYTAVCCYVWNYTIFISLCFYIFLLYIWWVYRFLF